MEMLGEPKRATVVHPHRLERCPAAGEPLVVRRENRLSGVDEAAPGDGHGQQAAGTHRAPTARGCPTVDPSSRLQGSTRGAPIARSSGSALTHDSAISAFELESHTTPPPTQRWICPSAIAKVRIV